MPRSVIVVGAGVIGLSCALLLSEKGYDVKIVANHFPTDDADPMYTSDWAGAHFRPAPSRSESDQFEAKLNRITQAYFKLLSESDAGSSVRFIDAEEYMEEPDDFYTEVKPGYSEEIDDFEILDRDKLPQTFSFGTKYKAWVLNPPLYVQYLQRKLSMVYGVDFIKANVISLRHVFDLYPKSITVNASGQGLQYDGGYDPSSYPIRGQTLLLRVSPDCPYLNKTVTYHSKNNQWTFVIPRPLHGGVILGGTKQANDYYLFPRDEDTQALVGRARILFPELFINGGLDIKRINVGFRPARKGGPRVELEKKDTNYIIHAYGTGGMGFELSYGVASEVYKLLRNITEDPKL